MAKELAFSITKKDFRFDYFRAGGPGGQNQNKRDTACRITHIESGISAESREYRTQLENKQAAFRKLTSKPQFRAWINQQLNGLFKESPEEVVEKQMARDNLLIECRDADGSWVSMD
jgi:protein subunit release factor B